MRKTTDPPRPRRQSAENRWYEASTEALNEERLKHRAEAAVLREQAKAAVRERREWESDDRARREYDFNRDVSSKSAGRLIATLSDWAKEKPAERITVRLMTPGGDEVAGLAVVDFLRALRDRGTPVDTLALGEAASMGSVLLQAGEVRYIAPNAVVLIHESRTFGEDAPVMEHLSNMEDRVELGKMLERLCNEILAERSVFGSGEELAKYYGSKDWWMTAEQAIEFGFADEMWRG